MGAGWEEQRPHRQADHPVQTSRWSTEDQGEAWRGLKCQERKATWDPGQKDKGHPPYWWSILPTPPPNLQVTLIPTFDSVAMHTWYAETHARHQALGITVLGSNSMVSMQDDAFPACKVEF